ncbi:MAG: hypothetical protein ACE362_26690 [Phaeodactylibacter xiamenensis]|uniref:Uncharacterized protein n=1 Tax=Phaeodactylibacter xiamenensis TaxID=1524460 RepID=A0A098S417_9BACT|nr:hypothetical protein [Phaeodactylibacter xiamenensis]KGE86771.1 hypothetical protein IX84_19310 [Phaeodactylibacter xiamenensis]
MAEMTNHPIQTLHHLISQHQDWDESILLDRNQFLTMEGQVDDRLARQLLRQKPAAQTKA